MSATTLIIILLILGGLYLLYKKIANFSILPF